MKLRSLREALRHGLLAQTLLEKLKRCGVEIVVYYLDSEGDFRPDPDWSGRFAGFEVCLPGIGDVDELAVGRPWIPVEELCRRFADGQLCIGLRDAGRLAAYTWADLGECNHQPNRFRLGPGEAYLYEAFTLPAWRGRDLAPWMRVQCYSALRERGYGVFYSITDYFNEPALNFKRKLGARHLKLYLYLRIGPGWRRNWMLREYAAAATS